MNKLELLHELNTNTFVRLAPSPTHGIGVFAIRDIPAHCRDLFTHAQGEWHKLSKSEVSALPKYAQELIENFCLFDADHYYVPAQGFKTIDLSLFLNHSDEPNIQSINEGEYFETLREIKVGEELFVDYGELVEEEEEEDEE